MNRRVINSSTNTFRIKQTAQNIKRKYCKTYKWKQRIHAKCHEKTQEEKRKSTSQWHSRPNCKCGTNYECR